MLSKLRYTILFIFAILLFGCSIPTLEQTTTEQQTTSTEETTIPNDAAELVIHYLDVGQADSIFIQLPNSENMLIDAGNDNDGDFIIDYIESEGVSTLDYVVGTHPHEDHIGGLEYIINDFLIGDIYMPNKQVTTQTYLDVLNSIDNKGLTINNSISGEIIIDTVIDNQILKVEILSPFDRDYSNINDSSIVIKLTYGLNSFLFMGDAETEVESELLEHNFDLQVDVLKVGHHGSNTSSSQDFLDQVNPDYAIISVGIGNSYGHPGNQTLDRLNHMGIETYRTDLDGTIVVSSNGSEINLTVTGETIPSDDIVDIGIYINEFVPAPSSGTLEWVEFYNSTDEPVDISGFILDDIEGGSSPTTIPDGTIISPNGFYVFELPKGIFNNGGDEVRLFKDENTLIDCFAYGNTEYNHSWYRITEGGEWSDTTTATPTKNTSNIDDSSDDESDEPQSNTIVINEFLPAPKDKFSNEWIELYNTTNEAIDISGYRIVDKANNSITIPDNTIIGPKEYYLYYYTNNILNNGGDEIMLYNSENILLDSVTYGSTGYDLSWYRQVDGGEWNDTPTDYSTPNLSN